MKSIIMSIILSLVLAICHPIIIYSEGTSSFQFSDIEGHWAKDTILWGVEKGIVSGYPDGTFKPNKEISEAEFLAILIRAYKPEITVSNKGHWAENYYAFAEDMNYPAIGIQCSECYVERNGISQLQDRISWREYNIRRDTVAELISSTQGVRYSGDDAIHYLLGYGLAQGKDPTKKTIRSYDGKASLKRAEAIQFIKNLLEKGNSEIAARPSPSWPSDVSLLPPIDLEPEFPFTEGQVQLDQIDDVVDGEFRFKLWNEKTKQYEPANYRLDETHFPEMNKRVFNAVKAIVDSGGFASIFYSKLEDGNGAVGITYHGSFAGYAFGNWNFQYLLFEKPYKDEEKGIKTNMQVTLRSLTGNSLSEWPYSQKRLDEFRDTTVPLVKDEEIFDYIFGKYLDQFEGNFDLNSNYNTTINEHKIHAHRFDSSLTYYNILFLK